MTIPKEIIEKAIAGGWEPFKTIVVSVDGSWEMIDYQTYSYAPPGRQFGEVRKNIYAIALDPTFWQALGKELEWENADDWEEADPNEMIEAMSMIQEHAQLEVKGAPVIPQLGPHWWFIHDSYQRKAHDCYDLILQGKDTEKFWKDLLVTK